MNSMKIGTYQMDTTFGLYLPEYTIPAPAVQTNFVKIIGRDGSVDLSNALGLHYDSRTWSLDFKCFDPTVNWHTLSSQVMNAIHGKRLNFEFDDDPNYFWTGRVSVQNYVSNHGTGTLKVTIVSDPFKYAKLSTIVTKTASTGTEYTGSMVTFNDGLIYDLSADIEPIQSLNGYSHPWPAGGGKNKLKIQDKNNSGITGSYNSAGEYVIIGTSGSVAAYCDFQPVTLPAGSYTFSISTMPDGLSSSYNKNGSWAGFVTDGKTITLTEETEIGGYISIPANTEVNTTIKIQLESGSSATSWTPYSNICPITGWTGAKVSRTGKNLWTFNDSYTASGYAILLERVPFYLSPGTYTFSAIPDIASDSIVLFGYHADGTRTEIGRLLSSTTRKSATATITKKVVSLYFVSNTAGTISNIQLELGSTATDYEPYQGETYDITFPSEAGTVYGGTLDVVTGVLTVTMAIVDLGTLTWRTGTAHKFYATTSVVVYKPFTPQMLCDTYKFAGARSASPWYGDENELTCYYVGSGTTRELYINDPAYTDVTEFKTAMNGVQLVYELATPLTYQLTGQEVEALVGTNNVWSDGGNVTVAVVTPETLTNNGRAVVPTLTASADMVLKWGNYSASVQQGTSTIPQLILENGANLVYIIGTGSISFTWQEASL